MPRYDYSPEDATLKIKAMPSSLHNAVANGSADVLDEMRDLGFLSRAERRSILMDIGTEVVLPTISTLSRLGGKRGAGKAYKQPDAAYYFTDKTTSPWRRDAFPRVVFEIGFSQKYETLLEDAKHWLVRAQGFVKVVVIVNLIEGPLPPQPTDIESEPEQETSFTVDAADNNGDHTADNENDVDGDELEPDQDIGHAHASPASSQSSTAQDYVDYLLDPPTAWVGPISGTIEMDRYDPSTSSAWCDGPQHASLHAHPPSHPTTNTSTRTYSTSHRSRPGPICASAICSPHPTSKATLRASSQSRSRRTGSILRWEYVIWLRCGRRAVGRRTANVHVLTTAVPSIVRNRARRGELGIVVLGTRSFIG